MGKIDRRMGLKHDGKSLFVAVQQQLGKDIDIVATDHLRRIASSPTRIDPMPLSTSPTLGPPV
jgi:hypothetical protein